MALAQAQFESAYAVVGSITQIVLPFHAVGDEVYRKSDFAQPPFAGRNLINWRYVVIGIEQISFQDSGVTYLQGATPDIAATCAGYPYSPATKQLSDPTTPFYYVLQRVRDLKVYREIHETDVYTEGLISTYIKNNLNVWWDL